MNAICKCCKHCRVSCDTERRRHHKISVPVILLKKSFFLKLPLLKWEHETHCTALMTVLTILGQTLSMIDDVDAEEKMSSVKLPSTLKYPLCDHIWLKRRVSLAQVYTATHCIMSWSHRSWSCGWYCRWQDGEKLFFFFFFKAHHSFIIHRYVLTHVCAYI